MVQTWYPITVCTNSRAQKQRIAEVQYAVCVCVHLHQFLRMHRTYLLYVVSSCTARCYYTFKHVLVALVCN